MKFFKKIIDKIEQLAMPTLSLEKEIVGIDLSHNYLRVVQLTNNKNDWSITRLTAKHYGDKLMNDEEKHNQLVILLREIKSQQQFDTHNAAISLPINDAIVKIVQIPYLEEDLLNTAIENGSLWQNAISIPGALTEYSIFWQVIKSDPASGTMSILFVASSISKVDELCRAVKEAGFTPIFVDVRCFALRNISKLYDKESLETSVYLEISGYENYMVFIHKDMPFIYDIFVTESDVNTLISNDGVVDAAVTARIASQVSETIGLFINQSGDESIGIISLVSSLNNIEAINEGLSKLISPYSTKILNPFEELKIPSRIKLQLNHGTNFSTFSVALGLATRRLDILNKSLVKAVGNINLLPNRVDLIEKETEKSKGQIRSARIATYFVMLMATILVTYLVMLITLPSEKQVLELELNNQALKVSLDKSKGDVKDYSHWFNDVEKRNRQVTDMGILDDIPMGVYVLEFKQVRDGISEISLQSNSPSLISVIIDNMSKKYKNVKLVSVETDAENTYQISKITFEII